MNTYLVKSDTNYNLMVHIVNAATEQDAKDLAKNFKECGAWDGCEVILLDTATEGVVYFA